MTSIQTVNLASMTFFEVKKLSKAISGKTNEELAEEIGMGHEHVARHFREAQYNLSPAMMPHLCKALGNNLQIEWQVIQTGAYLAKVDCLLREDASAEVQMAKLFHTVADGMEEWTKDILDKALDEKEREKLDLVLIKIIRKADECRTTLRLSKIGNTRTI